MGKPATIREAASAPSAPFPSSLVELLAQAWGLWDSRVARRRSLRALADLDDRLLRDVGLTPADVERAR